jgi:hypothetical protein
LSYHTSLNDADEVAGVYQVNLPVDQQASPGGGNSVLSLEQSLAAPTEDEVPIADDGGAGGDNNDENESLPQTPIRYG